MSFCIGRSIYYGKRGQEAVWAMFRLEPSGTVSLHYLFFITRKDAREKAKELNDRLDAQFTDAPHWRARRVEMSITIAGR